MDCTNHYIAIRVNHDGENQIISDNYNGVLPSHYKYNGGNIEELNNKKSFNFLAENNQIILCWSSDYLNNFSYMFRFIYIIC